MPEPSRNTDFTKNNPNIFQQKAELETIPSDEERLKRSVADVSSEIVGAVQENGEAALKDYFYNILSETDGSVLPEKRLVVFEYLANQQRLANHEEALKFGETAFIELGDENQESNNVESILSSLGNTLKQDAEDLTRVHEEDIIAKQRGEFDANIFIHSYDKLADYTNPLLRSLSNYSEKTENWGNKKVNLATDYSGKSRRLGGQFENQSRALEEAGKTIELSGETVPVDLTSLIDEEVVNRASESLIKIINSSMNSGEVPDINVMQELCETGEYDTGETMHQIDNSLANFIQIIEDGSHEIRVLKDKSDGYFANFCKQAQNVRNYVRSSRDQYDALHFSGKEKTILTDYGNSVKDIMNKFKIMKQQASTFSNNTRNSLHQDKKLDVNAAMFR